MMKQIVMVADGEKERGHNQCGGGGPGRQKRKVEGDERYLKK